MPTPFDIGGVELGHVGPECSFDAFIRKYNLTDPALLELAVIVRAADTDAKNLGRGSGWVGGDCRGLAPYVRGRPGTP